MWVVKIGGSLYDAPQLQHWLQHLVETGPPVIIVPGGGPFADQVREAQKRWSISDQAAHQMALHAMNQFGLLMIGIEPRLQGATEPEQLKQRVSSGQSVIWLPATSDPDVEQSWRVTSDSLSLWLAARVQAEGVLLVKSASTTSDRSELLDAAFDDYRDAWGGAVKLIQRDNLHEWPAVIQT